MKRIVCGYDTGALQFVSLSELEHFLRSLPESAIEAETTHAVGTGLLGRRSADGYGCVATTVRMGGLLVGIHMVCASNDDSIDESIQNRGRGEQRRRRE